MFNMNIMAKAAATVLVKMASNGPTDAFASHHNKGLLGAIEAGMTTTDRNAVPLAAMLPFGSTYTGYQRGAQSGREGEGMLRGVGGGMVGSTLGALGGPAGIITIPLGKAIGTHLATRSMLPEDEDRPKTKKANAVTSIESAIARRGAGALSRAVPSAAEGALGHATAAAASRGVPRSVSSIVGDAAGSGVRVRPAGPPPVPTQAKGIFAAPAVSPFAGTTPGAAPRLGVGDKIPGVSPMPATSTQHINYLSRQPGLGAAPVQTANMAMQPGRQASPFLRGVGTSTKISELATHLKFAASMARQGAMMAGAAQSAKRTKKTRNSQLGVSFASLIEGLSGSGAA